MLINVVEKQGRIIRFSIILNSSSGRNGEETRLGQYQDFLDVDARWSGKSIDDRRNSLIAKFLFSAQKSDDNEAAGIVSTPSVQVDLSEGGKLLADDSTKKKAALYKRLAMAAWEIDVRFSQFSFYF